MQNIIFALAVGIISCFIVIFLLVRVILDITKKSDEALHMHYNPEIHPWIDGDCCRCPECTERYQKELAEDLKEYPDRDWIQH